MLLPLLTSHDEVDVSWVQFNTAANVVCVSWCQFDVDSASLDVRVSWCQFDSAAGATNGGEWIVHARRRMVR